MVKQCVAFVKQQEPLFLCCNIIFNLCKSMNAAEYIRYHNLKPGDAIVSRFKEKKAGMKGLVHYVVILDHDTAIRNVPETGVTLISMDDVAVTYQEVTKIERFKGGPGELELLYQRAKQVLGKAYDLVEFNCESLANYLRYGQKKSRQVEFVFLWICLGILALIAYAVLYRRGGGPSGGGGSGSGYSGNPNVNYSV